MSDKARIILWLGFIMILAQIIKDWPAIRSVLFASHTGGSGFSLIPPFLPIGEAPPAEEPPPEEAPPPVEEPPPVIPEMVPVVAAYTSTQRTA